MSKYTVTPLEDFSGGENQSATPDLLKENEVREMVNANPILLGGIESRGGTMVETTPTGTRGYRYFEFEYVIGSTRNKQRLMLKDGTLTNADTNAVIKSGMGNNLAYEVMDNKLYVLANGMFFSYDGTTCTDVTTTDAANETVLPQVKKCKYLLQRGDRLFASGNPERPNELYYSQPFNASAWWTSSKVTTNAIPLGINPVRAVSDDGDVITGLARLHGALLVFKTRHIYAWFGYDPMEEVEFKQLDAASGTISQRSICKVENALLFLGFDGVYRLKGTYENIIVTEYVSEAISPLIKRITIPTDYAQSNICAVYFDKKYMLSVPVDGSTDCSIVLVYHSEIASAIGKPSWSHYTNIKFNDMFVGYDRKLRGLKAASTAIVVMSTDYLNDEGVLIDVVIRLRPVFVSGKEAFYIKKYRSVFIIAKQFEGAFSAFNIEGQIDYIPIDVIHATTDESMVWDKSNWDEAVWDFSETVLTGGRIRGTGKRLDLTIRVSELDNKILIYKLGIEFKFKKIEKVRNSG